MIDGSWAKNGGLEGGSSSPRNSASEGCVKQRMKARCKFLPLYTLAIIISERKKKPLSRFICNSNIALAIPNSRLRFFFEEAIKTPLAEQASSSWPNTTAHIVLEQLQVSPLVWKDPKEYCTLPVTSVVLLHKSSFGSRFVTRWTPKRVGNVLRTTRNGFLAAVPFFRGKVGFPGARNSSRPRKRDRSERNGRVPLQRSPLIPCHGSGHGDEPSESDKNKVAARYKIVDFSKTASIPGRARFLAPRFVRRRALRKVRGTEITNTMKN